MQANPGNAVPAMMAEAQAWAPWMTHRERQRLAEWIASRPPIKFKADTLAERIGCTYAERILLGIRTIGACDLTRAQRNKATRKRRTEAERERRHRAGVGRAPTIWPTALAGRSLGGQRASVAVRGSGGGLRPPQVPCRRSVASAWKPITLATHLRHRAEPHRQHSRPVGKRGLFSCTTPNRHFGRTAQGGRHHDREQERLPATPRS